MKRTIVKAVLLMAMVLGAGSQVQSAERESSEAAYITENVVSGEVQPATVQFGIDFGYSLGLSQREFGQNFTRKDGNMYSLSIKALALWNINRNWTAGAGVGIDSYNYGPNTMPLFLTGRFRPFERRGLSGLYAFTDLGYAPGVGDYSPGLLWDIGVGWRKMWRRHFGINVQFGYGLKQFRTHYYDAENYSPDIYYDYVPTYIELTKRNTDIWRHSLRFSVGLLF